MEALEAARQHVVRDQAAAVKRASAVAAEQTQKAERRHRAATLLIFLLLGGCWRFFAGGTMTSRTLRSTDSLTESQPTLLQALPGNKNAT